MQIIQTTKLVIKFKITTLFNKFFLIINNPEDDNINIKKIKTYKYIIFYQLFEIFFHLAFRNNHLYQKNEPTFDYHLHQ